jgi:predicted PurR-regulated permease PerM
MLGLDPRAARAAWTVIATVLLVAAIYALRRVLLIFVLALLVAYLLTPIVDFVDRFASKRRLPRNGSLLAVYVVLMAAIASIAVVVGTRVANEAYDLAARIPGYLKDPAQIDALPLPWWLKQHKDAVLAWVTGQVELHREVLVAMIPRAARSVLGALGSVVFVVLVPILSFFFLKDSAELREWFLELLGKHPARRLVEDVLDDVHRLLVLYIRALVALGLCTFGTFAVVLGILGVPYAVLLSLLAGVVEFIPAAGPLFAAVVILSVAAVAGYAHLGWILVFLVVYRLFLDYVLQPHFLGQGVALPPLVIIFGVLAGEQLAGIPGMLLCIPVLAAIRILIVRYQRAHDAMA